MPGRRPSPNSYIVDLVRIVSEVAARMSGYKRHVDIVIPVYENNFNREIAENMIFLTPVGMLRSIRSSFIEDFTIESKATQFHITDSFKSEGPSGYIPAWIDVPYVDDSAETLSLSFYWR